MSTKKTTLITPFLPVALALCALTACEESEGTIRLSGSATLPDCMEPPAFDLNGALWTIQGTALITSDGCPDVALDEVLEACSLGWEFTQDGNELTILSDNEYKLAARICGNEVHLTNGWWLPFPNEQDLCLYDDDDGAEVVIEAGSTPLTIVPSGSPGFFTMEGTLQIVRRGNADCAAEFMITVTGEAIQIVAAVGPGRGQFWILEDHLNEPELWEDPRAGIFLRSLDGGVDAWLPAAALLADGPAVIDVEPGSYGASLVVGSGFLPARLEQAVQVAPGQREALSMAELTKAFRALR